MRRLLLALLCLALPFVWVSARAAFVIFGLSQPQAGGGTLFPQMGSETSSVYPWATYPPGVTYNGGIPARATQCGATLTPIGGNTYNDGSNITMFELGQGQRGGICS